MLLKISKFQGFERALAERGNESVDLALKVEAFPPFAL
jgi:hypothetical protein